MAIANPVLERKTDERERQATVRSRLETVAEEEHNARIRDIYARLINPDNRIEDVLPERAAETEESDVVETNRPYLVQNARADAAIFRADNPVNMTAAQGVAEVEVAEEESEDAMPTSTTIQYQTIKRAENTAKVNAVTDKRAHFLGKKEKIIMAVVAVVIVALLTLIIVNSAVIAGIKAEITPLEEGIATLKGAIAGVNSDMKDILIGGLGQ